MAQATNKFDLSRDARERGYEQTHLRLGCMAALTVFIAVLGIVMFVSIWYLLKAFDRDPPSVDQRQSVAAAQRPINAGPPLQPSQNHDRKPEEDLASMHQQEDRVFHDLGWEIDPEMRHARPPADLVTLVAQRMSAKASATTTTTRPTEGPR